MNGLSWWSKGLPRGRSKVVSKESGTTLGLREGPDRKRAAVENIKQ